jgi:hypothetical protein
MGFTLFSAFLPILICNFHLIFSRYSYYFINKICLYFHTISKNDSHIIEQKGLRNYTFYIGILLLAFLAPSLDITYFYRREKYCHHIKITSAVTTIVIGPFLSSKWQHKTSQNRILKCGNLPRHPIVLSVIL